MMLDTTIRHYSGQRYNVFKNPTYKEVEAAGMTHDGERCSVRFLIDKKDNNAIYMWTAEILHESAALSLFRHCDIYNDNYFEGVAWDYETYENILRKNNFM